MDELLSRRGMGMAAGAMLSAGAAGAFAAEGGAGTWINVRERGAKGDGKTDDTKAIQDTIDAVAPGAGGVWIPPGVYLTGTLRVGRGVTLAGAAGWNYRAMGGSVLRLKDPNAACLLDITGAIGSSIEGLSLDGERLGQNVHGIFLNKPDYGKEEDAFRLDGCRIARFTGTGLMLNRVWCFSLRHMMIGMNGGDGVRCIGWDGFVLDNWLSGNGGSGWEGTGSASVTMTGNRIEWNRKSGILLAGANHYNITGNYIDRSGGPAISLMEQEKRPVRHVAITGNVIYRSGKYAALDTPDSAHVRMVGAKSVVMTGNSFSVGRDDGGKGTYSPTNGIVVERLENCVVKDNVLHDGALKTIVLDAGGHAKGVVLADNPGQVFAPPAS